MATEATRTSTALRDRVRNTGHTASVEGPHFLREFLRSPRSIGALAPSSRWLAKEIMYGLDLADMAAVVELGPGSGALTRHIVTRLSPRAAFIAVEMNPRMARSLRGRFPRVTVHEATAEELPAIVRTHGLPHVDCVISGLPWANLPGKVQERILGGVLEVLRPGGQFVAFAYLSGLLMPSGRRFRKRLTDSFASVETSRVVWPNLPPAFVYRCRQNGVHVLPRLGHHD